MKLSIRPFSIGTRRNLAMVIASALIALSCVSHAQAPAWWQKRGILNGAAPDDFAAINQGQLKNLVVAAVMELQASLPGGAGRELLATVAQWTSPSASTDDYSAVNTGQLKELGRQLYDRLIAAGYANAYPWAGIPDYYAMANIGQAKNLFSFNLTLDTDSNGLPDWWETKYFSQLGNNPNSLASVGSGLTLLQSYLLGSNPVALDSDGDGVPDSLDAYAQDATLSQLPPLDPNDHTPPAITLLKPLGAVLGP